MHYIAGRKGESEMAQVKTVSGKKETWKEKCARTAREVVKRRWLFFLLIPGIIFFAVFKYIPMYGLKIAFQDYNQYDLSKRQWVGDLLGYPLRYHHDIT